LTIQKFYRVAGGSTSSIGVASDVVLPVPLTDFRNSPKEKTKGQKKKTGKKKIGLPSDECPRTNYPD